MSKRRMQSSDEEEVAPEELTPEQRREKRRRDRAQVKSGKARKGLGTPLRRAAVIGAVLAVLVAILLIVYLNLFGVASPCLTLSAAPTEPYYPPSNTTNFAGSWCPPAGSSTTYVVEPLIKIEVNGTDVDLPAGIGINKTYTNGAICDLPITTPAAGTATLPQNVVVISSAWGYSYSLGWFFQDWAATFGTVSVGTAHPSQPVTYTSNDLLGFTADATHSIHLFVDNQPSTAGPGLILSTLPNQGTTFPSCVANVYGTGHTILLTYTSNAAAAFLPHGGGVADLVSTQDATSGAPATSSLTPAYALAAAAAVGFLPLLAMRPPP